MKMHTTYIIVLEMCTQQPLAHFRGFSFPKYSRNVLRIQIFPPTFQETVGSHLKPSLPVVAMATLNHNVLLYMHTAALTPFFYF